MVHEPGPREWSMDRVHEVVHGPGPQAHRVVHGPGPRGWSMDLGPCFVYVRKLLKNVTANISVCTRTGFLSLEIARDI